MALTPVPASGPFGGNWTAGGGGYVIEMGAANPGATTYPTGGYQVDFSARFNLLRQVYFFLENAGTLPYYRLEVAVAGAVATVKFMKLQGTAPPLGGAVTLTVAEVPANTSFSGVLLQYIIAAVPK